MASGSGRRASSAELAGQVLDAVDEAGQQVVRLAGRPDVRYPGEQLAQDDGDLAARQVRAEAEVRPRGAEADVRVGDAGDVEFVGGGAEHALVPVGRLVHQQHLV